MVIQHNIPAINAHRYLGVNNAATSKNLEKLSSGFRINRAGDDAAGLAISEKMRGQIRGLGKAEENTSNAINLIQTAEGGMQEMHSIVQRMKEIAVQATNGTYQDAVDRENLDLEFQELKEEFSRIADYTNYNNIKLLGGAGVSTAIADLDNSGSWGDISWDKGAIGGNATVSFTFVYDANGDIDRANSSAEIIVDGVSLIIASIAASGDDIEITTLDGGVVKVEGANDSSIANSIVTFRNGQIADGATESYTHFNVSERELLMQVGANGTTDQQVSLTIEDMHSYSLGKGTVFNLADYQTDITGFEFVLANGTKVGGNGVAGSSLTAAQLGLLTVSNLNVLTKNNANISIEVLETALNDVSEARAMLGAKQNRLEYTLNNLGVTKENLTAAESTIRDVDMAKEMMEFTKNSILVQSAQAMLAQANSLPQGVLQLLR